MAEGSGRPRGGSGQLREYTLGDGTITYSLRIRWQGERFNLRLGNELEGWNRPLAEAELRRILDQIAEGTWQPPVREIDEEEHDPTFHEFATVWLTRRRGEIDENTNADYSHTLTRYILPTFKDQPLSAITYETVQRWRTELQEEARRRQLAKDNGIVLLDRYGRPKRPYGARTINEAIRLLGQILERAVESEHYLIQRNPARGRSGLRIKRESRPPREHFEADELVSLIEAADLIDQGIAPTTVDRVLRVRELRTRNTTWSAIAADLGCAESTAIYLSRREGNTSAPRLRRAMIIVLALSGLRASEFVSLRWEQVDHTHGRIILADAKTPAGVREIYLSPFVRVELELYRSSLPAPPAPGDPVFAVRGGGAGDRFNLGRRIKRVANVAAWRRSNQGLASLPARIRPHTFRRTFITLSFQAGKDLVFVQTQAGHTDWKTTLGIYTQHSGRSVDPAIRELLSQMLADDAESHATNLHQRWSPLCDRDPT